MQRSLRITNFAFHHRSPKLDICVSVLYFFMQEQKYRDLYGDNGFFQNLKSIYELKLKKRSLPRFSLLFICLWYGFWVH